MRVGEFLRETYAPHIDAAKIKRCFFGALVGGISLLGASRVVDAVVTSKAVNKAEQALSHLPDCESGLLPVRVNEVEDKNGHPAQQFYCDGAFLYVSIPDVGAEDELSRIVVDWQRTRDYTEHVADQAVILPSSSDERYQSVAFALAGIVIGIGSAQFTSRSKVA
jgi:hypothetical protein